MSAVVEHLDTPPPGRLAAGESLERISVAATDGTTLAERIERRQPVIVTDIAENWRALREWTPESLASRFGDRMVKVYDARFAEPGKHYMGSVASMRFDEFLHQIIGEGRDLRMFLYNIVSQIPELLEDLQFPQVDLRFSNNFVFSFFGCKGAVTPLHYDIDMGHVFHTAVFGRRHIRLFAPDQARLLYQHPFTVRSYVDLQAPDFEQFPALSQARGFELVLEPGETLFMPAGYWHEFHYLDAGFGLSQRADSRAWTDRLQGLANLVALSPIDRLGNKIASKRWFQWKQREANKRAALVPRASNR